MFNIFKGYLINLKVNTYIPAIGGIKANNGNTHWRVHHEYIRPSVRKRAFKLFLRVIAMIGKFVDRVKTGNKLRK